MNASEAEDKKRQSEEQLINTHEHEGRDSYDMDVDRMVNEGLGGGNVTEHNGLVAETTIDSMGLVIDQDLE